MEIDKNRIFLLDQTNVVHGINWKKCTTPLSYVYPAKAESDIGHEYSADICNYFFETERTLHRSRNYMQVQPEITDRMRKILVDWLVDVVMEFKHHPETFFLTINIIDRFLSINEVSRSRLQLVGVAALLIAAKHEEVWPPSINDCIVVTANTYSHNEVINMEREMACSLHFRFTVPTPYPFACFYLAFKNYDQIVRDASFMFLESASHSYSMVKYLPSRVAAASVLLGAILVANNRHQFSEFYTAEQFFLQEVPMLSEKFSFVEIKPIASQLLSFTHNLCSTSSKLQAVMRKYLSAKFNNVASLEFPSMIIFS